MPRFRYTSRPVDLCQGKPFADAEEAWLWSHQCLAERAAGAFVLPCRDGGGRACAPLDVVLAARHLARAGHLAQAQLVVLMHYGARLLPPDPRDPDEAPAVATWRRGLACLEPPLRAMGIVA